MTLLASHRDWGNNSLKKPNYEEMTVSLSGYYIKYLVKIRTLRQEGYNQEEQDYLFQSTVMPNFLYVMVYRCTEPPLLILTMYSIF